MRVSAIIRIMRLYDIQRNYENNFWNYNYIMYDTLYFTL